MTTTAVEVQRRYLTINEPKADSDQLEFSFSSETPVTRYFGDEVLDHDRDAVDLSRLNGGAAPLLLNHDPDRVLGIVERAWIDEKRRGMARITWATNDLARQVRQDVEAGVMPNISVGYAVQQAEQEGDVMVVRKWQPIELSVVSIPADASIGVNRSLPTTTQQPMTSTYEPISTVVDPDAEYTREAEQFSIVPLSRHRFWPWPPWPRSRGQSRAGAPQRSPHSRLFCPRLRVEKADLCRRHGYGRRQPDRHRSPCRQLH